MKEEQRLRLEELKKQQKKKEYEKRLAAAKRLLNAEHNDFAKRYRFADPEEKGRIDEFFKKIPAITANRPDFSKMQVDWDSDRIEDILQYENRNVFICILCGSEELLELYSYGKLGNFVDDFENWYGISDYLLLLFDNFQDFIFIDDYKFIVKAKYEV